MLHSYFAAGRYFVRKFAFFMPVLYAAICIDMDTLRNLFDHITFLLAMTFYAECLAYFYNL
jgi:hypothetical protein